ncbi:hypothetical protein V6N13_053753 [Hibiscus sabdariffa]|uniref:Uncharacterized protein n=1 Tax=Hibiscus sabdariffa TaxID=183260 RepID=A0ABR2T6N7_9ROSI
MDVLLVVNFTVRDNHFYFDGESGRGLSGELVETRRDIMNLAPSTTCGSARHTALESSQEVCETHLPPASRFELLTSTLLLRGGHDQFQYAYCHLRSLANLSNCRSYIVRGSLEFVQCGQVW